jgi:hypothetical protein
VRQGPRVQPLLLRMTAPRTHEPWAMLELQQNVHIEICVQYRVGATAAQAGSDKETPTSKDTNIDIKDQNFDIVDRYRRCLLQYR